MQATKNILIGIGNGKVKPRGVAKFGCTRKGSTNRQNLSFYVTDEDLAILGRQSCEKLDLIRRVDSISSSGTSVSSKQDLMQLYADIFGGTGQYAREYHIRLKPDAFPVIQAARTFPYAKQQKLKETLIRLEEKMIIANVDKPTDWVNNLVVTEKKNGSMRVCLDPRPLNKAIKREHHRIPTPGDAQTTLAGKQLFTVVDMKDAFWHVKLSEESSYLCTFNTPWGRKRFLRMPFGISSASEILQQRNDETFGNIPNVYVIADDLIIAGKDEQEHDEALHQVMRRAREANVRFSIEKLQLKIPQVKYMGHLISKEGIRPDPEKVAAITGMPKPDDKKEVERLLGMIKYLQAFIPQESDTTAPLRQLLKKGIGWSWHPEHDEALRKIKEALTTNPVLSFYDVEKPVKIQADASSTGLGACLLQEGKPVAYASRTLTTAEKSYAQIEKEMLAITYSCRKFHPYIYGKPVQVETDHKPLEIIMKKPLSVTHPRLQRMLLQVQRYQLHVEYVPGKEVLMADALSRAQLPTYEDSDDNLTDDTEVMIYSFINSIPCSAIRWKQLQTMTAQDESLQHLKHVIRDGWPDRIADVPQIVRPYWTIRDELYEAKDILFKGFKVIIPKALQKEMLALIHETHQGTERCKERARAVMYWPGMSQQIGEPVTNCTTCLRYRRSKTREPMIPHPVPQRPWQKLATDVMTYKKKDYAVVIDYYSKYVELYHLIDKTAQSIITGLKSIFARHGIPDELVSDNMPFNSRMFKTFAEEWGFQTTTSSPTYPQSNGLAERNIQTIKQLLRKASYDGKDPYLTLQ